jgi:hypothetical protein
MSHEIHNQQFQKFRFFKEIGNKQFLGWLGSRLKPRVLPSEQFVFEENETGENFWFQTNGRSAFLMPDHQKAFAFVDPAQKLEEMQRQSEDKKSGCFQFFGLEDIVINHTQLLIDKAAGLEINTTASGEKNMRTRVYSVYCLTLCEFLVLPLNEIDRMKNDYTLIAKKFF